MLGAAFAFAAARAEMHASPAIRPEAGAVGEVDWRERIEVERALAVRDPAHRPRIVGGAPALGPASGGATFDARGAHIATPRAGRAMAIGLAAIGRADAMRELPSAAGAAPELAGPEVRIVRAPGVVEWWRSLPSGLEQGVRIERRPPGDGALRLEMTVGPDVHPTATSDDEVALRDTDGTTLARYAHLAVVDAAGARIPARLATAGARIAIDIDDDDARYPLVVDPLVVIEETTLLPSDGMESDMFGISAALSADGSRALVGCYEASAARGAIGSAHVFVRSGGSWTEEAILRAADRADRDGFGGAVALSSDATRAIMGAAADDTPAGTDSGSARVFVRIGATWAEEAALLATDGAPGDYFGTSVSLSAAGDRAIVGAANHNTMGASIGAAYIFVRTGATWAAEATLVPSDGEAGDYFGRPVVLSADGARAFVGAAFDTTAVGVEAGTVRTFVRAGTTWSEEAILAPPGAATADYFGASLAASATGDRVLVGAPHADPGGVVSAGMAHLFSRSGSTWSHEAGLAAADAGMDDIFGNRVALSSDGSRALVAATYDDAAVGDDDGSARLFVRTGTTWTASATLLAGDAQPDDAFGSAVALSGDGSRALVGAYVDDTPAGLQAGSARVFVLMEDGSLGGSCGVASDCTSGFCVDGVCCADACGGGVLADCQACALVLTGAPSGTCAPLLSSIGGSVTCRAAIDACDAPELCTGTSTACPPDALLGAGTVCRPRAAACDALELCDGSSRTCPTDLLRSAGFECRPAADGCDIAEVCDGLDMECPADVGACMDAAGVPDAGSRSDAAASADVGSDLDAGAGWDGGSDLDASSPPPPAPAATCRVSSGSEPGAAAATVALLAVAAARTRRRRAAARSRC